MNTSLPFPVVQSASLEPLMEEGGYGIRSVAVETLSGYLKQGFVNGEIYGNPNDIYFFPFHERLGEHPSAKEPVFSSRIANWLEQGYLTDRQVRDNIEDYAGPSAFVAHCISMGVPDVGFVFDVADNAPANWRRGFFAMTMMGRHGWEKGRALDVFDAANWRRGAQIVFGEGIFGYDICFGDVQDCTIEVPDGRLPLDTVHMARIERPEEYGELMELLAGPHP